MILKLIPCSSTVLLKGFTHPQGFSVCYLCFLWGQFQVCLHKSKAQCSPLPCKGKVSILSEIKVTFFREEKEWNLKEVFSQQNHQYSTQHTHVSHFKQSIQHKSRAFSILFKHSLECYIYTTSLKIYRIRQWGNVCFTANKTLKEEIILTLKIEVAKIPSNIKIYIYKRLHYIYYICMCPYRQGKIRTFFFFKSEYS